MGNWELPMLFPRFLSICALALISSRSDAQTVPLKKEFDLSAIASISSSTNIDYYEQRRAALRKNVPRIIFVPGILGSKIEQCQPDGSQCSPIWGTISSIVGKD